MTQLAELARKHGTDKEGGHSYAKIYERHFAALREKQIALLEIGVGGYDNPNAGASGLRMWKEYFPNAQIIGLDYYDKAPLKEDRIDIFQGSQDDPVVLNHIVQKYGELDIVIDDGSHQNSHVIASFKMLFPKLKADGIYVIEDMQTAYWPALGGSSENLQLTTTSVGFFKERIDGLNHREVIRPGYEPNYFDLKIESLHFYHNMVFVYKGNNTEPSNHLIDNQVPATLRASLIG
jgi:hypothetical protein